MKFSHIYISFLLLTLISCEKKTTLPEVAVPVTVTTIVPQTIPANFEFVGVTESSHPVDIYARVEGYLKKIDYVEGSFVYAGDTLFEIDSSEFVASLNEAKANLEKEQASLASAQKSVERYRPLLAAKAASQKDFDDAVTQLQVEQASVSMYQAKVDEAQLTLNYATITSPISGYTSDAKSREGALINPATNGLLTTVSVIDPIWVSISVSESYSLLGQEESKNQELTLPADGSYDVILTLADGSVFPEHGKVNFVSPVFDTNTGTSSVRAVFSNPKSTLRPGQFVQAKIVGATRPDAITVPQESVQQSSKGRYVWILNQNRRAERRSVETGDWYENSWIIKSGLKRGDVVIVQGVDRVKEGSLVKIKHD